MPNVDLSNHVPWLESKRRSRARRAEARKTRSRDRRRRTGALVAAATLTFAAGGALAQSSRHGLERGAERWRIRRRAPERARHHGRRRLRPGHAPRRAQLPAQPGPRRRRHRRPGHAVAPRPRRLGRSTATQPASGGGRHRAQRHAGQDRPVRVLRQPDRGLRRRASTAGSTSSPARPGASTAARETPPPRPRPSRTASPPRCSRPGAPSPGRSAASSGLRRPALAPANGGWVGRVRVARRRSARGVDVHARRGTARSRPEQAERAAPSLPYPAAVDVRWARPSAACPARRASAAPAPARRRRPRWPGRPW